MRTETIWRLPHKSQEFEEGPRVRLEPGQLTIAYDYEAGDGTYKWEEMFFAGVAAFAFTRPEYCDEGQIGAYDKLEEVADSNWRRAFPGLADEIHHYRIYLEDAGCYEVLASSFTPPQGLI
jgi:hypothetical protein